MAYRIVVDLSDRRLSLLQNERVVSTYPIAIGRMLMQSPVGHYRIVSKVPHPGGPFGAMWMGLSKPHYGIHGTNNPASIGQAVSHGCIRMYNADVLALAARVPIGTPVTIRP
ncbi:L,D-transpeptidase [Paenibacillus sp. P26]|nr:L,D-transpeptidase [Paenibacillus sp. P26]UUZ92042.1 L,D-transpeptidase [Paenibacillus sp. P25]